MAKYRVRFSDVPAGEETQEFTFTTSEAGPAFQLTYGTLRLAPSGDDVAFQVKDSEFWSPASLEWAQRAFLEASEESAWEQAAKRAWTDVTFWIE